MVLNPGTGEEGSMELISFISYKTVLYGKSYDYGIREIYFEEEHKLCWHR